MILPILAIILSQDKIRLFQDHLLLFFTGLSRTASDIAKEQIENTKNKKRELKMMYEMVDKGVNILKNGSDLTAFGQLLHESWKLKRSLSDKISTPYIDELYDRALKAGAIGGKLLGAGGGGFLLLFAMPQDHPRIKESFEGLLHVPFQFENLGSQIIFYEPVTL